MGASKGEPGQEGGPTTNISASVQGSSSFNPHLFYMTSSEFPLHKFGIVKIYSMLCFIKLITMFVL